MIMTEFQEADSIIALRNRVGNLAAVFHLLTVKMGHVSAAKFGTYGAGDFERFLVALAEKGSITHRC